MSFYECLYRGGEILVVIEAPDADAALGAARDSYAPRPAKEIVEYWYLHDDYWEVEDAPLTLAGLCENCDALMDIEKVIPLCECPDLGERLDPGSEVPLGECPECGAFVYIDFREE